MPPVLRSILAAVERVLGGEEAGVQKRHETHDDRDLQEATFDQIFVEVGQCGNRSGVTNLLESCHQLLVVQRDQFLPVTIARLTFAYEVQQVEQIDCGTTAEAEREVDL